MKKRLSMIANATVLALSLCSFVAAEGPSSVNPAATGTAAGLSSGGTVIAKILLIAVTIFMVVLAGYFALKKKEVRIK